MAFEKSSFSDTVFQPADKLMWRGSMDSRDVVLRKEGDVKGQYDRCGAEAGVPGLSRIFAMLSDDEARHAAALRALQSGTRVDLDQSRTLEGAKEILRHLFVEEAALSQFNGDLGSYFTAMDNEASTAKLCGELARDSADGWEKELLLKIAAEDEIHFTLLEQMQELLEPFSGSGRRKVGTRDVH
jgi:hypothetical protein